MDVMSALKSHTLVVLVGFVGGPLLLSTSTQAQSVYEALFGRPPVQQRPSEFYIPAPAPQSFFPIEVEPHRRTFPEQSRARPANVEVPPPIMPQHAKAPRAAPNKEIVAAVMADSTLHKGDIVVFPDGPRVYRGGGGSAHKASDFEDLRASRLVSDSIRKTVLASTQTTALARVAAVTEPKAGTLRRGKPVDVTSTGSVSVSASR
jgi:hypothetical protein